MKHLKSQRKIPAKSSFFENVIVTMSIFAVIFYPFLLPLVAIQAEDVATSVNEQQTDPVVEKKVETKIETVEEAKETTTIKDSEPTADPIKESIEKSTTDTIDSDAKKTDSQETVAIDQPAASEDESQTSQLPENIIEDVSPVEQSDVTDNTCPCDNSTDQCCPNTVIENQNDASILNNINSKANTGNDSINQNNLESNPQEQSPAGNVPLAIAQDSPKENDSPKDGNDDTPEKNSEQSESTPSQAATIQTGSAQASDTIVNETNTNIVSENYIDSVVNITGDETYDINLLDQFQGLLGAAQELNSANLASLSVENINNANIENDTTSTANSGENTIIADDSTETAEISTGDASANANIVNIVNRNLIGDTWIFSIINVIGNWAGDLIVPGEGLLQTPNSQVATNLEVTNENDASIVNNINASANSSKNSIENAANSAIITGNAISSSNTTSIVNTNIVQNNWFVLLINNLGSWTGKIIGHDSNNENSNAYEYNFKTKNDENPLASIYSFLSIHNVNQATITNNANANATTGNNSITGQTENAKIQTGNASTSANVVNIANTNIIGNNWMFTIVNILGSWTGNAVAAYPDLTISIEDGIEQVESGGLLTYSVSYENIGQANCDNAEVAIQIPETLIYQNSNISNKATNTNSIHTWSLGKINAGEKKSFTFTALATDNGDPISASVDAIISTSTKEIVLENNYASDETTIFPKQTLLQDNYNDEENFTDINFTQYDPDSHLKISRPANEYPSVPAGNLVTQSIYVENTGADPLGNVLVTETINNPNNEIIGKYSWPIPILNAEEKILITYQLMINPDAITGTYGYRARGIAINSIGEKITSNKVSNNIIVFAMYFNNQGNTDIIPASVSDENDTKDSGDKNILGVTTTGTKTITPWFSLAIIAVYACIRGLSPLLKKFRTKTSLEDNLLTNNISWGTIHKIQPKKMMAAKVTISRQMRAMDSTHRSRVIPIHH